jgi:polar amino acid transport system substrate-binding protein
MSSLCNNRIRRVSIAVWMLAGVLAHRVGVAAVLNVCIDQANPTSAMDLRVVRAVARTQGYAVKPVPFVGYGKGGDGVSPGRFSDLLASDCQLIMGFPVDVSTPHLPPRVEATSAYASTGFVLISRAASARKSLDALPQGSAVGIAQLDTYAGLLLGSTPNVVMHVYPSDSVMLDDVNANHIAVALAWQPAVESYRSGHHDHPALRVEPLRGDHMLFNLVALYAPEAWNAARMFDDGLHRLESTGALQRLIDPYPQAYARLAAADRGPSGPPDPSSAEWPAAHLQNAVAWQDNAGQLVQVASSAHANKTGMAPALYTADQASKGSQAYTQSCAKCHAPSLEGQSAGFAGPALKGADFADPSYDFHISDIFNFVSNLMPADAPGTLTHDEDVEIMAFILQQNGYPAGSKELVFEQAQKSKVAIRYYGK